MKKIILALSLFSAAFGFKSEAQSVDSMQHKLDTAKNLCLRAELYTNIAACLVQFNQPQTRVITTADANKAIDYVLKAIHINNKYDDTLAIRNDFDCLSQAYFLQRKYTQAKWFSLQSAGISRDRRDVPHIIYSLMQLAKIKTTIKDYKLAQKDFNEAIVLARFINDVPQQIVVERGLAAMLSKTGKLKESVRWVSHYSQLSEDLQKASLKKYYASLKIKVKKPHLLAEPKQISDLQEAPDSHTKIIDLQKETAMMPVN